MKKLSFLYFIAVLSACILLFSGCVAIQPVGIGTVKSSVPQKSALPQASEIVTPPAQSSAPLDVTVQPANIGVKASFPADVNGDGTKETISVGLGAEREIGNDIILRVSDGGASNDLVVDAGYFESANLTETPGGAPCLILSVGYEDDYYTTYACSLSGGKPAAQGKVEGNAAEVLDSSVTVSGYVDAIGTWYYTRLYDVTDAFAFEPATDMMIDMTDRDPLVTKIEVPVEMLAGGEYKPGKLKSGTKVYPVATDGSTFLFFNLGDGTEGRINFTLADYECYIEGLNVFQCFVDVPYAG